MASTGDDDLALGRSLERWKRWVVANVRWLTRTSILVVLVFVLLHQLHAPVVERLGEVLGFAEPTLPGVLILLLAFFTVERIVVLEDRLSRPPVLSFETRVEAYRVLSNLIRERGAKHVDLIQFSGQTALPLLRDLAESSPQAHVRLLLQHPDEAARFDSDGHPDHRERIFAAIDQIAIVEEDYAKQKFRVEIFYYRAPASVGTALVDSDLVAMGWYYAFYDKTSRILRLRGHNAPTVLARGSDGTALREFASRQFDNLMVSAEPARDAGPTSA